MLKTVFTSLLLLGVLGYSTLDAEEKIEDDLRGFSEEVFSDLDGFTDEVSGDLEGFSDEEANNTESKINTLQDDPLGLSGNIAFKTSVGYKRHEVDGVDYSGVNQAQTSIYLQLDRKLSRDWKIRISADAFYDAIYDLRTNESYRQDVLDDYRTQLRLDDTYLQGRISTSVDLKAGRQIVVWGKSDNIRITDVINPLDTRLPGMTDIEDLRLSVGMVKLDYYLKQWNLSAMIIPESRIMREPTPRGEFFPVDNVFNVPGGVVDPFPPLKTPATSWENLQYAFAANGVFSGWDFSFYAAEVLDQKSHFEEVPRPGVPLSDRTVSKVQMLGSAINVAYGSWLFKSEAAVLRGVKYNTSSDEKERFDALIGLEYMGIEESVISVEVANRHIFDYEQQMQYQADFVDQNEVQSALRITRSFANDRLNATAVLSIFGLQWENGGFARVWLEYEVMDAVHANVGIVDYIGGDKPFREAIKDNDRVFADITYSF